MHTNMLQTRLILNNNYIYIFIIVLFLAHSSISFLLLSLCACLCWNIFFQLVFIIGSQQGWQLALR